jgi:hypothetical protein
MSSCAQIECGDISPESAHFSIDAVSRYTT